MSRAALRLLGFLLCCAGLQAGEVRRPVPTLEINGRPYVRIMDVAVRLKLSLRWVEPGRKVGLTDATHRLELWAGGRFGGLEMTIDGLNIFLGDPVLARGGDLFVSRIDLEHRLVPLLHGLWNGPPPRHPLVVAIDPGHGGWDPGKENAQLHLQEKTLALDAALRLKSLLEKAGYQVVMTRTADRAVAAKKEQDLPLRAEMAVLAHADLFISIHFNSAPAPLRSNLPPDTRPRGTEVYTFAPAHQSSTEASLGHNDDQQPNKEHPDPAPANQFDAWNVIFAHAVHRQLLAHLHTDDRGEKLMHLAVLRGLACPGILVESAFLSNDGEARRAATPAFRQEMAEAMLAGINAYAAEIDSLRPPAPAPLPAPPAPGSAPAALPPKTLSPPQRPS
jgi:N-acetylmuramoyl-L-alanine amidase